MNIHVYARASREYLRTEDWTPPHPWVALPADAVTANAVPLPEARAGFVRVLTMQADGWDYVEDHRGEAGWLADGTPHMVMDLGPLPDGWVDAEPLLPLASLIAAKQAEIRDAAEAVLAPLKAEYGPTEIASWDTQKEEAKALLADPNADAPYIRSASSTRGMDPLTFAARVITNNAAWATIGGHVGGQRLAYQDTLDEASTLADEAAARAAIAAIVPVYTLPDAPNA